MRPERRQPLLVAALLVLLGPGCATLNESECRSTDWYQLGAHDGADGYGRARLEEHRQACSEYGLGVDERAWREGYQVGLQDYCTADNGYRVGRRGLAYGRVCTIQDERDFLAAYELGRETHGVEQEIAELERRIESLQQRLRSDKLDDETRADVRRQLNPLYLQADWLRRSLDRLEREWWRRTGP